MFKGYSSHSMCVCLSQASLLHMCTGTGLINVVYIFLEDQCVSGTDIRLTNRAANVTTEGPPDPGTSRATNVTTEGPPDPGTTSSGIYIHHDFFSNL